MWTAKRLGLFVWFAGTTFSQTQPSAAEILKRVTETYKDVSQYELEVTATLRNPATNQSFSGDLRIAYQAPDKYRVETTGDLASMGRVTAGARITKAVEIYDGSSLWVYLPESNEYTTYPAANLPRDKRPQDMDLSIGIQLYRHAAEVWNGAGFLREESVVMDGGSVDCFVLEAGPSAQRATLWIDKSNFHVLRVAGAGSNLRFNAVKLNERMEEGLFKFSPPAGARKLGQP